MKAIVFDIESEQEVLFINLLLLMQFERRKIESHALINVIANDFHSDLSTVLNVRIYLKIERGNKMTI